MHAHFVVQAQLERQVKDLNVRIVDLETKSYANSLHSSPSVRQLQSRIDELTAQLKQASSEKFDSSHLHTSDKAVRDMQQQLAERERLVVKLEGDRKTSEGQINTLRQTLDKVVSHLFSLDIVA